MALFQYDSPPDEFRNQQIKTPPAERHLKPFSKSDTSFSPHPVHLFYCSPTSRLFENDRHPRVTARISMKVRRIRSGMLAANTKGIKKLKRIKSMPNKRQPKTMARFNRLPWLMRGPSHAVTQEIAIPVSRHHSTVSTGFTAKDE